MKPEPDKSPGSPGGSTEPRIICGTDFTENAHKAARAAAAIAGRLNLPVVLVHAIEAPGLGASHAEALEYLTAGSRESLLEEVARLRKAGVTVEALSPNGRADEILVKLAREGQTRLITVSSLGWRGTERWLLGSVAERTAERATVPTLVVRDAEPFEAWARGERPLKVFAAFNFTVTSEAALNWVKELHSIGPCDVTVGYVDWPSEQRARLGARGPLPLTSNPPEVQALLDRDLRTRVAQLLGEIPFRSRVEPNWGRPDARLAAMAKEEGADLIIVGSHQYHGFERLWHTSVSRGLLHNAATNVAVIPLSPSLKGAIAMKTPVQRVVVATDFSPAANYAIAHAYSILQAGGTVHLVHVMHPHELPGGEYAQVSQDRQSDARHDKHIEACAESLRALIPVEAAAQGFHTEVEVAQHADAAEGICQAAERFGADVICLGTHGRTGLAGALAGSVARKVMAHSRRPMLIVRPPVE